MMRWFALTCLTVIVAASASGCGNDRKTRATRRTRVERPVANAEATTAPPTTASPTAPGAAEAPQPKAIAPSAAPAPAAAASAPLAAIPVGTTGAGGAAGSGMAVVILMLPAEAPRPAGAPSGTPRTYKLSLSANADTATIQVDGQPTVTAPVQRVFPSGAAPPVSRALPTAVPRVPGVAPGLRSRYAVQLPPTSDDAGYETRGRQLRRAAIPATMRPALAPPVMDISPNGAPIID